MTKKISVIIPVYNTGKYLSKCLKSICNQTLSDIEIICINDSSSDDSLDILNEFSNKDNRIIVINFEENKGAAEARNKGIELAQGKYIGFVDSDDFVDINFYEKLYKKAIETNADITKGNLIFLNCPQRKNCRPYHNIDEVKKNKLNLNHIPTTLIKKELLIQHDILFPTNLCCAEDIMFEVKIAYFANKIELVEDAHYKYYCNRSSLNNTKFYNKEKSLCLSTALKDLVNFFNDSSIDEKTYTTIIQRRFDTIINNFIQKYNNDIEILDLFTNEIETIKNIMKYPVDTKLTHKLDLLKKISSSRTPPLQIETKIPKRIFYVWFGEQKSSLAHICIENWKEKLPDYEIIEINEDSSFFDFHNEYNNCEWFKDVYDKKLWAFVSDYVRCKVLYEHGGIYLDTDITIKKDLSELLCNKFFVGEEENGRISAGIFGSIPKHDFLKHVLNFYQNQIYESDLYIIPDIFTEIFKRYEYNNITIYPFDYFYPFSYKECFSPECITKNTYTIHWWNASWVDTKMAYYLKNKHILHKIRKVMPR